MNQIEIGKLIAKARKEKGYTQQELANLLFVTDKAVSKWERGLSLPEHNILVNLSKLLDIEINDILLENNENERWIGVISLKGDLEFYNKKICAQTIFDYLLSYYILIGIKDIYIENHFLPNSRAKTINIHFNETIPSGNKLVITDPFILFGPNLTRTIKELMVTGYNVKFLKNNIELPMRILTKNKNTMTKTFRNGYIYFPISESNYCEIENYLKFYTKLTNEKMFSIPDIEEARK